MWDKIVRCARMEIGMFRGIVFIAVFLVIATVVLLYALNRNEEGIANNLDELFAKLDIESKFANAETCGILYYTVTGTVYCQQVRIMGRFSPENDITDRFLAGLPAFAAPEIDYEAQLPISACKFSGSMPPSPIAENMKLAATDSGRGFTSQIKDNMIFYRGKQDGYPFELYLLGKSGYFILNLLTSQPGR